MAYTSKAQLIARWGTQEVTRSADRDPQDGVSEDAAIAAACADASSLVDSYLVQAGVKVPMEPVSDALVLHATNIAMYQLSQAVGGAYTDEKRKRFEDATAWLKMQAAGNGQVPGADPSSTPTQVVRTGPMPGVYTAATLRGGGLL